MIGYLFGGLLCIAVSIGWASPWLVLRAAPPGSEQHRWGRRLRYCSGLLLVLVAANRVGLSFSAHTVNWVAVMLSALAAGLLTLYVFCLRPSWLGTVVGVVCIVAWLGGTVGGLMGFMLDGYPPATAMLGNGMYCRKSAYGFGSIAGEKLEVLRRYGVIDFQVESRDQSDGSWDDGTDDTFVESRLVSDCRGAIALAQKRSPAVESS